MGKGSSFVMFVFTALLTVLGFVALPLAIAMFASALLYVLAEILGELRQIRQSTASLEPKPPIT
jgi:hypothetical protein